MKYKTIDLFAGIGGIRIGFESIGGKCVFTSEWNEWSKKTYIANFGDNEKFIGDITNFPAEDIPDHDVLLAGFPCQPFSIAKPHGFECTTQGTLFFDVARIISIKKPKAFMLENVKNLVSHNKGNTFKIIMNTLENELGYKVYHKVINGKYWVPQNRERIIIVGFKEENDFSWDNLAIDNEIHKLKEILHPENGTEIAEEPYTNGKNAKVHKKYILSDKLWKYLQDYAKKQKAKGNGFGYGLVTQEDVARTLYARYYKDGSEILISRKGKKNPRRLTPRECARLMGFDDSFKIVVSDTQAYKQFGNSVVVPLIKEVAKLMAPDI